MKVFSFRPTHLTLIIALISLALFVCIGTFQIVAQEDEPDTEAVKLFNQGQDAHEKGDLRGAIDFYEKALKMIPAFPEAALQRGNAFVALGRLDDAEAAYRHASDLREDWTLALAALGDVLVQKRNYVEAETVLSKAIELDELNFPAYTALTELRIRTNSRPEERSRLLATLKSLTSKASPTASIWTARGALENSLGDLISAKLSLQSALKIEPKNVSALSQRASIALVENDPGQASSYISKLESISPNSASVKVLRARLLYAEGKQNEALNVLTAIGDRSAEAESLRKEITTNSTVDPAELEKQLAGDPKSGLILGKLCSTFRIKDPAKALDYCRRAVEAEPTRIEHAIGFGAALTQAKRFDEAIIVFRKLLPTAPDNATIRANLATALFFAKRYAEAKAEYQWLTDRQPDRAVAYYFLAISYDQLGEYVDAMANYQQFLRLADAKSSVEIEKVNLRLPSLQKQIKDNKGKRDN